MAARVMLNPVCKRTSIGEIPEVEAPGLTRTGNTGPLLAHSSTAFGRSSRRPVKRKKIMIVMKFGGSSVESARAIQRVAAIVRDHSAGPLAVVVSAMGRTTDR